MSTFKGVMPEFPAIRVDFFRHQPEYPAPLACFLSHVHSDHLAGLESFKGPFIYCSAATRQILLRLEKPSVRLFYARGILENAGLQTYKHLETYLKPIPLNTPTTIDLYPGCTIRVTLLEANHCVGAVMFLFEGDGQAVLYTGDIRCEPRFVTSIAQNPNMIEYSSGIKTLDRIYLDTSIVDTIPLQTKAQGLQELLKKVQAYPKETIFYFQAWTYGYEEVWIALSKALNSKIHVDEYKMRVFESLITKSKDNRWASQTHLAPEAAALVGFTCGNKPHGGCLTRDENVRIHSCENGMRCSVMDKTKRIVRICPIVSHLLDGRDMLEVGIGGGGEDLTQTSIVSPQDILDMVPLLDPGQKHQARLQPYIDSLKRALSSGRDISLPIYPDSEEEESTMDMLKALVSKVDAQRDPISESNEAKAGPVLPDIIRFPYARHSSLPELRAFVSTFKPKDIVPCTFDADHWVKQGWTVDGLFGDCCSGHEHMYDTILHHVAEEARSFPSQGMESQKDASSDEEMLDEEPLEVIEVEDSRVAIKDEDSRFAVQDEEPAAQYDEYYFDPEPDLRGESQTSTLDEQTYAARRQAFDIACGNLAGGPWGTIELMSTTDNHTSPEAELGHR